MLLLNFTVWQHAWPMGLWLSQFVVLGIHAVLHLGMIVAMLLPGPTTECMLARKVISAVVSDCVAAMSASRELACASYA